MEVRCCCQPQKLLGWLPAREGDGGRFWVYGSAAAIWLKKRWFRDGRKEMYLAYSAEGVSIKTLRLVQGFVEND